MVVLVCLVGFIALHCFGFWFVALVSTCFDSWILLFHSKQNKPEQTYNNKLSGSRFSKEKIKHTSSASSTSIPLFPPFRFRPRSPPTSRYRPHRPPQRARASRNYGRSPGEVLFSWMRVFMLPLPPTPPPKKKIHTTIYLFMLLTNAKTLCFLLLQCLCFSMFGLMCSKHMFLFDALKRHVCFIVFGWTLCLVVLDRCCWNGFLKFVLSFDSFRSLIELLTFWRGFQDLRESKWNPLPSIELDVLCSYLRQRDPCTVHAKQLHWNEHYVM